MKNPMAVRANHSNVPDRCSEASLGAPRKGAEMVNFDIASSEVTVSLLKVEAADRARHSIVVHRLNP